MDGGVYGLLTMAAQSDNVVVNFKERLLAGLLPVAAPPLARWLCDRAGLDDAVLTDRQDGFDAACYGRAAGRRFWSRRSALLHYLLIGSAAGLRPRPDFEPLAYRRQNPDVAEAGYEPFAHYLRFGRAERRLTRPDEPIQEAEAILDLPRLLARLPGHPPRAARVDVVVPVYGARQLTLRALESVLQAKVTTPYELTVIDDASPDRALRKDLEALARAGHLTLMTNEHNIGFVASANRAFALHGERDVVLLNSDTRVYDNWLDRLLAVLHSTRTTATASPLSNAATILSYPIFLCDDHSLGDADSAAIDRHCARLGHAPVELPTAHGFCMAVKRACLAGIGPFDLGNFGYGYGEENDFSLRAIAHGWRHLAAADVFVWHRGGASFGTEREARIVAAQQAIERLHPGYAATVRDFISADPLAKLRCALDIARICNDARRKVLCLGATAESVASCADLKLTLVSDIAPYAGFFRIVAPEFGPIPNLPRFSGHAVDDLALAMQSLDVRELRRQSTTPGLAILEGLACRAAEQAGIRVSWG